MTRTFFNASYRTCNNASALASARTPVTTGKIILAPMEGVLDPLMRSLLTSINDYDLCVTEFLRVVDYLAPKHLFYKLAPELAQQGRTETGTPVRVQLLGQHPQWLAENAVRAIELGSHGVDLNFGCPAKMVNKSKGGAVLLKTPETIYQIVRQVKQAVGAHVDTSVKIRLGFDDASLFSEIIDAISLAKADLLTIHARTKKQGYQAPAYWHYIAEAKKRTSVALVANGEIWSKEQALRCQQVAQTDHIMLGRGALALPNLANVIKYDHQPMPWSELVNFIQLYSQQELAGNKSFYFSSRLKQWLRYLKLQYPQALVFFERIKRLKEKDLILVELNKLG